MYELNGQQYSLADVMAAAEQSNLSLDDYISQVGIKKIEETLEDPYNEGMSPDFQTPTTPGAVVEGTVAPDTESKSEDGSLESIGIQTAITKGIETAPGGSLGFKFVKSAFDLLKGVPEYVQGAKETLVKTALNFNKSYRDLENEEKKIVFDNIYTTVNNLQGPSGLVDEIVEINDNISNTLAGIDVQLDKKYDSPNNNILEDFKQGNYIDAISKTADGVVEAIPSVMAAFSGPGGLALIGTSSAGSNYSAKKDIDTDTTGNLGTFALSTLQGGIELTSEMVTRGILKGFGNNVLSKASPEAVKNIYKNVTKTMFGRVVAGSQIEAASETLAQEATRLTDSWWDDENLFKYKNEDGSYDTSDFFRRNFDLYLVSSIVGGGLGTAGPRKPFDNYIEGRLESNGLKKENLNIANKINSLTLKNKENPDPLVQQEIEELTKKLNSNKVLNRKVLESMDDSELVDYAKKKVILANSKEKLKDPNYEGKEDLEKLINKEESKLDNIYNDKLDKLIKILEKPIKPEGALLSDFGILSAADKLREVALDKAKQTKISNEVQDIYNEKGVEGAFEIIEKFKPIVKKLVDKRSESPNFDRELLTSEIEIGLISDKADPSTGEYKQRSILGLIREYDSYVKKQKAAKKPIAPLSGFINKQLPKRMIEASKKILGEQFTEDVTEIKESRIELDDTTREALDLTGTRTPEQNAKLNDIAGITKEEAQENARQILKSKLPGIVEKSGRDKNQIRTAINNASILKVSDKILDEMGGKFTAKEGANNQFASFLGVHYDILFGNNNIIPDYVKNKLELFSPKQVRRETTTEGDAAGKGVFEYENPTFDQVLNFYTDETKGLSTLRARKERLADIIAPEIIKNEIADALADPEVKKDFLERQKLLKKEIPQDAIPKLLERIDRMIESVDQFGKTTLQSSPIPIVPATKVFLKSLKTLIKSGVKFSEALSKAIEKFKQALKGATKEQKSLAERILNYHIKSVEDLNKLQEKDLIGDLSLFMNQDILDSSDSEDFASNNKKWNKLVEGLKQKPINMKTPAGRKRFLKIAKENGFVEKIPKSVWRTLQGTTQNLGKGVERGFAGNLPFRYTTEVDAWIKETEAEGYKFADEGIYADMTKRVTKSQYNNLENLLSDKDFIQSQKNSLEGLKKLFLSFESLIKQNPKENIPFVAAMLSSTSAYQGHFMRSSSPVTFYEKGYKDGKFTEEHTLPASLVAKYLFLEAVNGNVDKSFKHVAKNFQQGALSKISDDKLAGEGYNGEKFTYKEKTPQNWFIKDNIWARYFNINVALQDGGIKPENIIMANGKTIADIYKVNNAGYGIKGVNFNNEVIQDFKIDEVNKENAKQVYAEKDLNKEFNEFLEKSTGIGAEKVFSKAKAEARAKTVRKGFGDYFVPPGAEDFAGLMHKTLAKGKEGEKQLKFYQDNLYTPYNVANENITRERAAMFEDFRALKKKLSNVPKKLKKLTKAGDFTYDQAVRVYMWNKLGQKVPGLSETDLKSLVKEVNNDKELNQFANELLNITKGDGYVKPENNWMGGNIATDLMGLMNSTKRSKHLEVWQNNVDQIFSEQNLNKLEAAYGKEWVTNLKKTLERMKIGSNRKWGGDKVLQSYLDWVNGSVGAIMFLNTRSAVLQTISNINYLNFSDNNPLQAAKAFANQKQYWSDFKTIFNSDYLQERRGGNKINVNESELALAAEKGGIQGTISLLLNKGFIFTKIADSFAIASGGASMYRNRINKYIKEGLSEKEATEKAFVDFKAITEETQQSSRPDRISEQQASNAGRLFLAFANTPMQYNRIIKKNAQDLVAGRGNRMEKVSKIIYYSTIQNLIFNAMQKALFALAFAGDDEEEKEIEKYSQIANGMADSLLRGMGMTGNAAVAVKNIATDIANRAERPRPNFQDAAWKALTISPPIYSKVSKLRGAGYSLGYTTPENIFEPKLDNPALSAGANIISATTNIPLDRALRKAQNIEAAMSDEAEWWQSTALLMGWGSWELGMQKKKETNERNSERKTFDRTKSRKTIERTKRRKTF